MATGHVRQPSCARKHVVKIKYISGLTDELESKEVTEGLAESAGSGTQERAFGECHQLATSMSTWL